AHLRAGVTLDHALTLEQNTPQWKCEPEDVAGLGPRRPRRAKHENRASRRTSRGWGLAVRGERNTRIVRAGGRRGAGAPPSEASETRESCEPEDVASRGVGGAMSGRRSQTRSSLRLDRDASRGGGGAMRRRPTHTEGVGAGGLG